jgi:hypothetical protein
LAELARLASPVLDDLFFDDIPHSRTYEDCGNEEDGAASEEPNGDIDTGALEAHAWVYKENKSTSSLCFPVARLPDAL